MGWRPAPPHPREAARLASLRALALLGTAPEPAYDRVCALAQKFLNARIALVALIDDETSHFKACLGVDLPGIPKEDGPCGYTILHRDALVIPDLRQDPLFAACPVALAPMNVRFYAGVPLFDEDDLPMGTLCILDTEPRNPDAAWVAALTELAAIVQDELALTRSHRQTRTAFEDLRTSEERYTNLVSTVPGAVYRLMRTDAGELRFTFISEGIRDLCGLEPEAFRALDEALAEVIHPGDLPGLLAEFDRSSRTLEPVEWQGRLYGRNGRCRWVQTTARPEMAEDGRFHWAGIVTDIGALKAAEAEIRAMNRTLEARVDARTRDLHDAQIEMLTRLGLAAEARDDDTGTHIARVARVSALLARGMGMSEAECEMVRQATPMHDIGKISVPDAVLMKPGRLDDAELQAMRRHAIEGARMLEGGTTELVRMAETIARTHHERWDGSGYPHGLQGEEIPLVGRIVAVADVFDALTSERPYKRAWSVPDAMAEIVRGAGSHFDPEVVRLFVVHATEIAGSPSAGSPTVGSPIRTDERRVA